jgi:hypothetical protein
MAAGATISASGTAGSGCAIVDVVANSCGASGSAAGGNTVATRIGDTIASAFANGGVASRASSFGLLSAAFAA